MASKFVIRQEAALPSCMKVTVLAQEVIRRERNTCAEVDTETRIQIRNCFLMKLRVSGYDTRQRTEIMLSGLRGYRRMVETEKRGGRRVNRARNEGADLRRVKKILGKTEWFRTKKKFKLNDGTEVKNRGGPPIVKEIKGCSKT